MNVQSHRLVFNCSQCDKPVVIINVKVNRLGQILVEALCAPCGTELEYVTDFLKVIVKCAEFDFLNPYDRALDGKEDDEKET